MSTNQDSETQNSPAIPFFYANAIEVATSGYDMTMLLTRSQPGVGGVDASAADRLVLYGSPILFKRLSEILVTVVERYEKTFGVIPLPHDAVTEIPQNGANDESSE